MSDKSTQPIGVGLCVLGLSAVIIAAMIVSNSLTPLWLLVVLFLLG